jgi:hypothetical protein
MVELVAVVGHRDRVTGRSRFPLALKPEAVVPCRLLRHAKDGLCRARTYGAVPAGPPRSCSTPVGSLCMEGFDQEHLNFEKRALP